MAVKQAVLVLFALGIPNLGTREPNTAKESQRSKMHLCFFFLFSSRGKGANSKSFESRIISKPSANVWAHAPRDARAQTESDVISRAFCMAPLKRCRRAPHMPHTFEPHSSRWPSLYSSTYYINNLIVTFSFLPLIIICQGNNY